MMELKVYQTSDELKEIYKMKCRMAIASVRNGGEDVIVR